MVIGRDRQTLIGTANLADQTAKQAGAAWISIADWPELEDGFVRSAPVDSLRPNGFGLHHVHGNVKEWCQDRIGDYQLPRRDGDGLREAASSANRILRGGSFNIDAREARAASRSNNDPTSGSYYIGGRAARAIIRRS